MQQLILWLFLIFIQKLKQSQIININMTHLHQKDYHTALDEQCRMTYLLCFNFSVKIRVTSFTAVNEHCWHQTDGGVSHCCKIKHSTLPLPQWAQQYWVSGAWLPPISKNDSTSLRVLILHHAPPSTVRMHAQRCREGESAVRRVTDRIHMDQRKIMGRAERENQKKPQKNLKATVWEVENVEHKRKRGVAE